MYREAKEVSERIALKRNWKCNGTLMADSAVSVSSRVIELADQRSKKCVALASFASGPLHDAAEVCRTGIPTIMLFVQSLYGISHNKIEDTKEEHLIQSVKALDLTVEKVMNWLQSK